MSLKSFIDHLLAGIFNEAKHLYNEMSHEEQEALKQGSGITQILKITIGKAPAEVRALIAKTFPELDEVTVEKILYQVAHAFNIEVRSNDLDGTISTIQTYLSLPHGNLWDGIMHGLAVLFSLAFSKDSTADKIGMVMEYVFKKYVFKKIVA